MSDRCKVPKPQLHGLLRKQIIFNLSTTFAITTVVAVCFQVFYVSRQRRIYADFYKNYDAEKEFNRMAKRNVFTSVAAPK